MKNIHFIRHGLSEGNAGLRTKSSATVHLVPEGVAEAIKVAAVLPRVELVVISPYCRTQETASHYLAKHPGLPVETWPVYEFTYLKPELYDGTTEPERLPYKHAFWERCDPNYRDAPEAESYALFAERVETAWEKLWARTESEIAVFSHGLFMRGMLWKLIYGSWEPLKDSMAKFRHLPTMPNGGMLQISGEKESFCLKVVTNHLGNLPLHTRLEV